MQKPLRIVVSSLLALCLAIAGLSAANSSAKAEDFVASPVASVVDVDSAAVVKSSNGMLDIPRDLKDGVKATTGGSAVSISLPNAQSASRATRLASGVVEYAGNNGSSNAVVPTSSGVQMLTTIGNSAAPTQYAYALTLSRGGAVKVLGDGRAVITDSAGKTLADVAAPWAIDANGTKVPTHFETNGRTLTQVVDHTSGHFAYPIVADPSISFGWSIYLRYSKQEVRNLKQQGVFNSYGILWGVLCSRLPNNYLVAGCSISLGTGFWAISQTFQAAANENKCVEVRLDYSGGLDGWRRYAC